MSRAPWGRISLAVVLAATFLTLALGYLLKSPCLDPTTWDGGQYRLMCYSDVAALYGSSDRDRGLTDDRIPYVDARNEYPVLSGVAMWVAAIPSTSFVSFFNWTAVLLSACALVTAATLHRLVGARAMFFALSPTLALFGFVNWDLLAVALATLATAALLRGRSLTTGALLGLGAAAKLYPALLVPPFAGSSHRREGLRGASAVAVGAVLAWVAVNLPFALASPGRWSEFYRFSSDRPPDWDSAWFALQHHLGWALSAPWLNVLSGLAFAVGTVIVWVAVSRRRPHFPPWTFGFPVLVVFLLTGKVFSPQFGLWLLPWFALTLPSLRLFAAFEATQIAVFVTRQQWFVRLLGFGDGLPFWAFEIAVAARAVVLIACLVTWVRRREPIRDPVPEPALEAA
ncbi:MAG TPA: glycosyltransferase 87 family protein [Actinomycetota bacterium]|nr:glycosyltransferase 87 family protein [Actinomycetota bacterium]